MWYWYKKFQAYRKNLQFLDEAQIVGNFKLCRDKWLTIMQVQRFLQQWFCFREILAGRWHRWKYIVEDMFDLLADARREEKERLQLDN